MKGSITMSNLLEKTNSKTEFDLLDLDDITKEPYADSRKLAETLGRTHDNVLKTIRKQRERVEDVMEDIIENDSDLRPYLPFMQHVNPVFVFEEEILASNGQPQPYYKLNRDAVVTVVTQLQGKQAMAWILAYIGAFNMMEARLSKPNESALQRVEWVTQRTVEREMEKLRKEVKAEMAKAVKQLR